jgi:putative heme-binding domain-containing protein
MIAIRSLLIAAMIFMVWGFKGNPLPAAQNAAQESPAAKLTAADIEEGKALYGAQCAGCHGVDGSGGMGPNIRGSGQRRGDQGMFSVIRNGIPGTGMGPVMSLNDKRAWQTVAYVRTLGGSGSDEAAKGDAAKGKAVYQANGCEGCHAIAGQGGGTGPDLTVIGRMRAPKGLRDMLLNPGANPPADTALPERASYTGYLVTHVVTKDGRKITGLRVNEDTFTLLVRDLAGHYYSFDKADLQKVETEPGKSLMPSYTNLSATELDDLVAYLASLKGAQ